LEQTSAILTEARTFFLDFLLAHHEKLNERVSYYSEKHQEMREGLISANELRSWLEECTVSTPEHPHPFPGWDFKARFPGMPSHARRAAMKEAIGKARSYLTALATFQRSGKKKGKPGFPGATDHPTFYQGAFHTVAERQAHQGGTQRCSLGGGHRRGQSTRHEPVLLPLRRQGGKVFFPRQPPHRGEMGQAVLLSGVSLPGQCRSQRIGQHASGLFANGGNS
jgi:hypothetical protein